MENLMLTPTEAAHAVIGGEIGAPRFTLTADEAARLKSACEKAGISGPLLGKVLTLANFASAKEMYSGGKFASVEMR